MSRLTREMTRQIFKSSFSADEPSLSSAIYELGVHPFYELHDESAKLIGEDRDENGLPSINFLRLNMAEKKNLLRSYSNNVVLQAKILENEDFLEIRRFSASFRSSLLSEFPDKGLMKSAIYANFWLRSHYPDSAYAAQIGSAYIEYAFFAYGIYFETEKKRLLSLRDFENLLEGFNSDKVLFTDAIKLYKLQTFIEMSAEGKSPFYTSERDSFEGKYRYSEDDFRCIPSERIFPMVRHDPEDWKAALIPLEVDKNEVDRFRSFAADFIESRPEISLKVTEKEIFRFQNVSCANSEQPEKGSKLRVEVRSGYEMNDDPFIFKRTLINVSTSNYRDSWINTPESRKKLKYFEILCRRLIRNVPEIPDGDMELDGYASNLVMSQDRVFVMGDCKKWGITFPVYLIRIFCEEAEKRFPVGWTKLAEQLENASLMIGDKKVKIGTRGFGLGNLNYMSSIIHYLILKMTNCEKFIVRSDDSLSVFKNEVNPYFEIYLKEKLGFLVNRKKVNISSKANVFCENYTEIEAKFQSQYYEKLGYMTAQIGQVMRKVCNSVSSKFFIGQASNLAVPAMSLIQLLAVMTYQIFGYEFDPHEIRFHPLNGGWASKYYHTNLKDDYIALEGDIEHFPDDENLIKKIYKNHLEAIFPKSLHKKSNHLFKIFEKLLFSRAGLEKEFLEGDENYLVPIETPYEYIWNLNDQLSDTQRLNKNAHLRQRKWKNLENARRKRFSEITDESVDSLEIKDILLERIEENFLEGKAGYAMPYSIFEDESYDTSPNAFTFSALSGKRSLIVGRKEPLTLEEEDVKMAEFLKAVRNRRIPYDIPRFPIWKESKKVLYSISEYGKEILVNENFREIIEDNEDFLAIFNIPTEITYLDWSHRHALEGDIDFYRRNFEFKVPSKKSLYSPTLFRRRLENSGNDPESIFLFDTEFLVNSEDYSLISEGIRLISLDPDKDEILDSLFRCLYQDGFISPRFLMRREEILQEIELKKEKASLIRNEEEEKEILLEIMKWAPAEDEDAFELAYSRFLENSLGIENKVVEEKNIDEHIEDLQAELGDMLGIESSDEQSVYEQSDYEEEFDFSYDVDDFD